jgi:predicted dehydrogenase
MTIRFRDGAIVNLLASFVVGGPDCYKNSLTLCGTKGVIYYATGPKPHAGEPQDTVTLSSDNGVQIRTIQSHAGQYDWKFFAQRVLGEVTSDVTTPEEVVSAIRVVNAMSTAELSGQTILL